MGRKATTGRFETREQLVEHVWFLYEQTECYQAHIARNCKVNEVTVSNILKAPKPASVTDLPAECYYRPKKIIKKEN